MSNQLNRFRFLGIWGKRSANPGHQTYSMVPNLGNTVFKKSFRRVGKFLFIMDEPRGLQKGSGSTLWHI